MAAPKRSKAEREAQLAQMATLLAEGATEREIAERFDLAQSTVHRDIQTIEARWRERAEKTIDTWKARLLAGHEHTIAEASAEWHRSKEEVVKIAETTELLEEPAKAATKVDGGEIATDEPVKPRVMELTKRLVTTEGRVGDPRYQQIVINARVEQAKIVGAYSPVKQELAGKDGGAMPIQLIRIVPPDADESSAVAEP